MKKGGGLLIRACSVIRADTVIKCYCPLFRSASATELQHKEKI